MGLFVDVSVAQDKQALEIVCEICGQQIVGRYIQTGEGHVYHQACYEKADKCPICVMPIMKGEDTAILSGNRDCHLSCFRNAIFCGLCGEPICRGQQYRVFEQSGEIWHLSCFRAAPKCGITGRPIASGVAVVRIGDETFIKTEYDKRRKCLISGLPLLNHGQCLVNARTGTFVLEKFKDNVRQCYSCGDWLPDGHDVDGERFLCGYCYENGVKDSAAAQPYFQQVKAFFRKRNVAMPKKIEIAVLPPGQLVDEDNPEMRGHCQTNARTNTLTGVGALTHKIEILWGFNPDVFSAVLAHELSHAVIAEARFAATGTIANVPYEEGRCEFTSYTFSRSVGLPAYIIDGFSSNQVENYRKEFLYVTANPPADIETLLSAIDF